MDLSDRQLLLASVGCLLSEMLEFPTAFARHTFSTWKSPDMGYAEGCDGAPAISQKLQGLEHLSTHQTSTAGCWLNA